LNIHAEIHHMSVGEARTAASSYDVVFCSAALTDNFKVRNNKTKIIGLVNLLSEAEIEAKIRENLLPNG